MQVLFFSVEVSCYPSGSVGERSLHVSFRALWGNSSILFPGGQAQVVSRQF